MSSPIYPSNANDPTLTINNVTDGRIISDYVNSTGSFNLTNPQQTLEDFNTIMTNLSTEINTWNTAILSGLTTLDKSYFSRHKQIKILTLIKYMRRLNKGVSRLSSAITVDSDNTTTRLPNATLSINYPSSLNRF